LDIGDTIGFSIGEFWKFGFAGRKLEYSVIFFILQVQEVFLIVTVNNWVFDSENFLARIARKIGRSPW